MKALHEEPGYMSADPLLHRDNLDQRSPENRESGTLGSEQPEQPKIRVDREEASIYVQLVYYCDQSSTEMCATPGSALMKARIRSVTAGLLMKRLWPAFSMLVISALTSPETAAR